MAILTHITGLTLLEWAYLLSVAGATGLFTLIIYRLYLDPLARFPGPRLAALTGWYEMYFDCIKAGRYWVEIEKMHKQYGKLPPSNSLEFKTSTLLQGRGENREDFIFKPIMLT